MKVRRKRTGLVVSLAGSILLHLVLLAALARRPPPPLPVLPRPLELEILTARPPAPPVAPKGVRAPPQKPAPAVRPVPKRRPPPEQISATAPTDVPPPAEDVPRVEDTPARRPEEAQVTRDAARLRLTPGLTLTAPPSAPITPGTFLVPPSGGQRYTTVPAPPAPQSVNQMVSTAVQRGREERGMSPTYFIDVGKALTDLWDVQRIAKSHPPKSALGANVQITQDRTGTMVDARLLLSSSDQAVDVGLLEDLRAGAGRLPPPPPDVLRGRQRFSSLWFFKYIPGEAISTTVSFDLVNLFDKRAIPKPNHKHVELIEAD